MSTEEVVQSRKTKKKRDRLNEGDIRVNGKGQTRGETLETRVISARRLEEGKRNKEEK